MDIVDVLAKMDETLARMDTRLARQDEILARMDERLARQDDTLRRMDERLARQDDTLRRMDDRMDKLTEFMAACHHEASAAHQATAVAMSRLAEHTLVFDRMLRLAERLLQERG